VTTDLWMLVGSALLCLTFPAVYLAGRVQVPGGLKWDLGNRERPLEAAPWVDRAVRAHANMVENLTPFAILVLVAHVTGRADSTTALGAIIFFAARVAHAVVYIAGITGVRSAVYIISLVGEAIILARLVL
jgi:uncharacterized MAPEG superfamily protein